MRAEEMRAISDSINKMEVSFDGLIHRMKDQAKRGLTHLTAPTPEVKKFNDRLVELGYKISDLPCYSPMYLARKIISWKKHNDGECINKDQRQV